jgi:hypothetical protein
MSLGVPVFTLLPAMWHLWLEFVYADRILNHHQTIASNLDWDEEALVDKFLECQKCTGILGDSGSIVLARDGRIVGILDGGAGPSDETDTTYLTPYWWIEQQIKSKYPGCFLYDVDE